ncbi:uncharacterized protein HMPREF1541_10611 [Cyphellophora europaea CBS 101466]|uniref:D-xylose 1-dehydrogenase (NADP(+), D-xylono-1,5-lactone-forming) n=1 Tax=Cyphellophora europaea (strain CBS 101466) TaxID=1220924 RepID=W2S738_CYPE1|nr:uncharacterized protein HMPREF1541_10611 [Cyphellophora europaea CBS 101466]ETN44430.1 hypothetical protein HMPREF1541_10611 [Cyphellophora europaea CBS 101466]
MAKEIRWGILATGGIAKTFTRDLLVDPTTRDVQDVKHTVTAAASSSSASRAQDFLKEVGAPSSAKAYGSYDELVKDSNVDIIYVATPHSHHYQNVMLCLNAGKNVLCEKAFTVNAAQARKLVDLAKEKGLFLMEAVWTRYFPLSIYVRDLISSGKLGNVTRCFADLALSSDPEKTFADGKHRMVNPDLAGGPLLDLGVYALNWVMQCLYHTQDPKTRQRPGVLASVKRYEPTGCDEMCTMLLTFPRKEGGDAHGVATTSIRAASAPGGNNDTPAVRVQGDKGEIQVYPMIYRPLKTKLILTDGTVEEKHWPQPGPGKGSGWKNGFGDGWNSEGEGHGMFWEADDAARALVSGRKEGSFLGWDESVLIMEIMDEVRKAGDLKYPEKIETLDYPVDL